MALPWLKIIKIAGPILLVLGVVWLIYHKGFVDGKAHVQKRWDFQISEDKKIVEAEKAKNQKAEGIHREQDRKISDELVRLKEEANNSNTANELATADRLRKSEQRASLYRRQAEAGASERANLAGHAAELDSLLSESIGLVEEGRVLVELRDGQIRQLASQIKNDRQLISGQDANGN